MRIFKLAITIVILISTMGCLYSFNAPYFEEDIIYNPALVGFWTNTPELEQEKQEIWTFEPLTNEKPKGYFLTLSRAQQRLEAHLVSIGKYQYLDLFPIENENWAGQQLVPFHVLMRCSFQKDILYLGNFNLEDMAESLKEGKANVTYVSVDSTGDFFAGPTAEVREWILRNEDQAFLSKPEPEPEDGRILYRIKTF